MSIDVYPLCYYPHDDTSWLGGIAKDYYSVDAGGDGLWHH